MNIRDLRKLIKDQQVEFLDLKFVDLPGQLQHMTLPMEMFSEDIFTHGLGFDGSSIRGFQTIDKSDMLLRPDISTAFLDPFCDDPTLSLLCNVKDPVTLQFYTRDARYVAEKAQRYMSSTGIADTAYFAPEAEFYIFDEVRFKQTYNEGFYFIDSHEGVWNTGAEGSLGYRPRLKGGYVPAPPVDSLHNLRAKMVKVMQNIGLNIGVHHHEVGTGGQTEIGIKYDKMCTVADNLIKFKYIVKNVAYRYNKTVTFMPKPILMDNGSGMHVHQSLWKNGKNIFFGPGRYGELSELADYYIGGLLHHAPSLLAFCAPTTNSYRRLVPGFEAPVNLVYSQRNRSACIRIPTYEKSENAKRLEFRCPDPSCNPYLAFAAILMAGLDGIKNRIVPPDPVDEDLYEMEPEEKAHIASVPGSLKESIDALEQDHDYLMAGNVFTQDLIDMWISYKRKNEIDYVNSRPHPAEFTIYYDI